MGSWYSVLILREKDAITVSSSPTIIEPVESQPAPKVGIFVTKKEHIQGYTNTFAGGTTVPAQVTIVAAASKGAKGAKGTKVAKGAEGAKCPKGAKGSKII